ncbi:hypothetical protein FSP39_017883 [Pinctada imbricata]|uniref:RNA helicase n=1 Tax=Pinctada imbricata TaxID=66713 RepID=A0AA88YLF7_PINIB|nr:hypothetical protein FSP39_017883 [Pinctada imbricata]
MTSRKWTFTDKRDRGLDFLRFLKTEKIEFAGMTKEEIRSHYAGDYRNYRAQIAPNQQHLPFSVILQTLFVIGRLHLRGIHIHHGPAPETFFNSNKEATDTDPPDLVQPAEKGTTNRSRSARATKNGKSGPSKTPHKSNSGKVHHKIAVDQHIIFNKPTQRSSQAASGKISPVSDEEDIVDDAVPVIIDNSNQSFIKRSGQSYECQACSAKCTSAPEMERHKMGRRHRLGVIAYKLKNQKDYLVKNKENIEIRCDSRYEGAQGVIHLDLEENRPKTIELKVCNTSDSESRTLLHCEMLKRIRVFQLDDKEKVTESQKFAVIPAGQSYTIKLKAEARNVGSFHVPVAFHLSLNGTTEKEFHIIRYIQAKCKNQMTEQLMPSKRYRRPPRVARNTEAVEVIRGYQLPRSSGDNLEKKIELKQFYIEDSVRKMINRGFKETKSSTQAEKLELSTTRHMLESQVCMDSYVKKFSLLLNMEEIQMEVDIRKYDMESVTMNACPDNRRLLLLEVPGLAENRPSVLRGDWLYVRVNNNGQVGDKEYQGFVHEVRNDSVALGFNESLMSMFVPNMKFNVRFVFNRLPLKLQHRACELAPEESLRDILFPKPDTICTMGNDESMDLKLFNKDIEKNQEQCVAVSHILRGTSRPAPYIVFGPPGTGKTSTIVEAMKQVFHKKKDSHILACTPSNSAADLLVQRLLQHVNKSYIIRLNAMSRAWGNVPEKVKEVSNYNKSDRAYFFPPKDDLSKYRIVICTLVTAGRLASANFQSGHFTHVFIDEAGHAVEPEALISIAGILTFDPNIPSCSQLVLAGDPRQLGPILRSPFAIQYGLDISLLERFMTQCEVYQRRSDNPNHYDTRIITKLLRNYRSHPVILEHPNKMFYENELIPCANEVMRTSLCDWEKLPRKNFPVIFHGVIGQDMREDRSPSFFNVEEATTVFNYVSSLLKEKKTGVRLKQQDIGIISPYRKQVQKIQTLLRQQKWDKIQVGSVEEFQGQERLVIIVSTVRSNPDYLSEDLTFKLGFLKNPKRFNVTLTRAKALLIVVGNPDTLSQDPHWKGFIDFCCQNKAYVGADFTPEEEMIEDIMQRMASINLGSNSIKEEDDEEENIEGLEKFIQEVSKYNEQPWRGDM